MTLESVWYLAPETILIATATIIYLVGAFRGDTNPGLEQRLSRSLGVVGFLAAAFALLAPHGETSTLAGPGNSLSADLFSSYIRWLTLGVGFVLLCMSYRPTPRSHESEQIGTLLMAVAGTMLVASARDLVLLFLGLELVSIPTYVLLYVARRGSESQEATIKYFFLSIVSSAVLLYGFSFLYGATGSTNLAAIHDTLAKQSTDPYGAGLIGLIALILLFASFGFRITAVPFHFYAPDVYQGTTHVNAALLSVLPKIVGFVAIMRVMLVAMPGLETFGWRVTLILAIVTMTVGNVMALWQDNLRRLLAYSSIAHAGYMLIGVAVYFAVIGHREQPAVFNGAAGVFFYLAVYALATLGTFAALAWLGSQHAQVETVDDLAGAGRTQPMAAIAIAVFMFSLAGIPPLAGFWGKLALFTGAVETALDLQLPQTIITGPDAASLSRWLMALAIVGVLNAAIAAAYYLRIVAALFFRPATGELRAQGGVGAMLGMLACLVGVVLVGIHPSGLDQQSRSAVAATRPAKNTATSQVMETRPKSEVAAAR
ncbi:MAG: NADH-quinone oxidoreductase subunit N [Planctomycetes bacterium]|nr:NADH-quinone oxidoreductase subunit N [Planctomycetota bacterium]